LRVLQVHTRYRQPGGEDTVVESERSLLEDAGHVVEAVEFHNPEGPIEASRALLAAPWNSGAAKRVVADARRFEAEVVHVHNTWFALSPAVFPALKEAGFPTVATMHNYRLACVNAMFYRDGRICIDCLGRSPWPGVRHACYRGSRAQSALVAATISTHRRRDTWARDVDVVIALTSFAGEILAQSGVPAERIMIKPNTMRDPGPRADPPSSSDMVLFVGRLAEEKGVEDLLEAWTMARPSGRRLAVVGDGPLRGTVERTAGAGVEVLGRLSHRETVELMATARVLVHPSRWFEGLPMVLVEAAAHGIAAIVPGHGALPDVVGAGGWTFESGSIDALASVLSGLSDDAVDAAGGRARAIFEEKHSDEAGLVALETAYQTAQRGRRA
jgi:glycosyltransferase involved in cell wall biosynthesis